MAKDKKKKLKPDKAEIQLSIPMSTFTDNDDLQCFLLDLQDLLSAYGMKMALPDDIPGDTTLKEYLN